MANRVIAFAVLLTIQGLAFKPVWSWYVSRMWDGSGETWGLLALGTFAAHVGLNASRTWSCRTSLSFPSVFVLVYAVTYPFVPRLMHGMLAFTAMGSLCWSLGLGRTFHVPSWGLLMLSLPVIPSFQFYLGYPVRVVCGMLAVPLLQLGGFSVIREGTCLNWSGQLISIDAPCSGVRMLWAAMYVAFSAACFLELSSARTAAAVAAALAAMVVGNALRAASLFHLESRALPLPAWSHEVTGLLIFGAITGFIVWVCAKVGRRSPCAQRLHS